MGIAVGVMLLSSVLHNWTRQHIHEFAERRGFCWVRHLQLLHRRSLAWSQHFRLLGLICAGTILAKLEAASTAAEDAPGILSLLFAQHVGVDAICRAAATTSDGLGHLRPQVHF